MHQQQREHSASVLKLYTPERTTPRKAPTKQRFQPPREYLVQYRASGIQWIAGDIRTIENLLNDLSRCGVAFTEAYAILELHLHIQQQTLYTYRDYARRWGWEPGRAQSLFRRLKLSKTAYAMENSRTQNPPKSGQKRGVRTQSSKVVRKHDSCLYRKNRIRIEKEEDSFSDSLIGGVTPLDMTMPDVSEQTEQHQPERRAGAREEKNMSRTRKSRNIADVESVYAGLQIPDGYDTPEIRDGLKERIRIRGVVKVEQDRKKEVSRPWPEFFAMWLARYTNPSKVSHLPPDRFLYELERANLAEWDDIHVEGTAAQFEARQRALMTNQGQSTSVGMVRL